MTTPWDRIRTRTAMAAEENADSLSRDVALISVNDEHIATLRDDGVGTGGTPNSGRRRIEAMLRQRSIVADEHGIEHQVPTFRFLEAPSTYRYDRSARGAEQAAALGHDRDMEPPYSDGTGKPALPSEEWSELRRLQIRRRHAAQEEFASRIQTSKANSLSAALVEMAAAASRKVAEVDAAARDKPAKKGASA